MDISIIIVNYNTAHFLKTCLDSILNQKNADYEIIVVDNGSTDNSFEILKDYENRITLIKNNENLGFGKANNIGAKIAKGDFLFLLNQDTEFTSDYDLKKITDFVKANKHYGLVSTKITEMKTKRETKPRETYPGEKIILHPLRGMPGTIAWVLGAVMILPKEVYAKIHGFDEDFFLYGEDIDICLRVRKAGYKIGYLPEVEILHFGGCTEITKGQYSKTYRKQKALFQFYTKHYSTDDCQLLYKHELKRASFRALTYKLRCLLGSKRSCWKYEHYKAIVDVCNEMLPVMR